MATKLFIYFIKYVHKMFLLSYQIFSFEIFFFWRNFYFILIFFQNFMELKLNGNFSLWFEWIYFIS